MKRYINAYGSNERETIEEINSTDFVSEKEFNAYIATRVGSYRMIFKTSKVYVSRRCCKSWSGN